MDFAKMTNNVQKFTIDNTPMILTGIGAAGAVVTGVLAYRAGYRSACILASQDPHESTFEKAKRVWPELVPPVAFGAITVTSIVGAHRIGSRRAAAVAAAYALSERAYDEYREKVLEKFGQKKNQAIYDEIAQEKVDKDPPSTKEIIITGNGDVMCYDTITGRYFLSSMEAIKKAENEINRQVLTYDYASLTDFYDKIGLSGTTYSEEVGWRFDNQIDIYFSTVISEDGKPCLAINYTVEPVRKFYKLQ